MLLQNASGAIVEWWLSACRGLVVASVTVYVGDGALLGDGLGERSALM